MVMGWCKSNTAEEPSGANSGADREALQRASALPGVGAWRCQAAQAPKQARAEMWRRRQCPSIAQHTRANWLAVNLSNLHPRWASLPKEQQQNISCHQKITPEPSFTYHLCSPCQQGLGFGLLPQGPSWGWWRRQTMASMVPTFFSKALWDLQVK